MEIQVSIIIVNYNTEKVLEGCLSSVRKYVKAISYEVIVVDNDSQKGSLSHLQEAFPEMNFLFMEKNLGFGMANNAGATVAKGRYLYLLNPDASFINDAPHILYRYMEDAANANVAISNASMYGEGMCPMTAYDKMDQLLIEYKKIFNLRIDLRGIKYNGGKPQRVRNVSGANLFIRKEVFDEVGGFDKDFFMYYEEIDLCDRVRKKGYSIMSLPDAKVVHSYGASAENKNETMRQWSREEHWYSKFVYFRKARGLFHVRLLYFANMLKYKSAVSFYKMKGNNTKLEYWFRKREMVDKAYSRFNAYLKNK